MLFPSHSSTLPYFLSFSTDIRGTDRPVLQRFLTIYLISRCRRAPRRTLCWWGHGWRAIHEESRTAEEQGNICTHHRQLRAVYARRCILGKDGE